MTSSDYPYVDRDYSPCRHDKSRTVMRVRGYMNLPKGNKVILRLTLASFESVPTPIVSDKGLEDHTHGVYFGPFFRCWRTNQAVLIAVRNRQR